MKYMFKFPDIGEGLEEGKILEWYVEKGQTISSGDALVKMETDKVVTDIPSPKSGVIAARFGGVGETVRVGNVLVEIDIEGVEGVAAQAVNSEIETPKSEEVVEEKGFGVVGTLEVAGDGAYLPASAEGLMTASNITTETKLPKTAGKVLATPVARAMAKDIGIDINQISGTGPGGRVSKKDVENYRPSQDNYKQVVTVKPAQDKRIEVVPISQIRKTIAKNMLRSKQNAAHMSVMDEVEVSELVEMRKTLKAEYQSQGINISYLPFAMKAIALALKSHPTLNAGLDMEAGNIIYKHYYNLGIAVDTDNGLVVPVIHDVDKKSIMELSLELNEISEKARARKLTMDDMKDGTFTITSYGSIGGYFAVPVINYPQVAIFGIGKLTQKPIVQNNEIVVGNILPISMSVDHRIVDGGEVARFLNEVLAYLRNPVKMLIL